MWKSSPSSSNCSRRYTEESARTDAADTARRSSDRAVMSTTPPGQWSSETRDKIQGLCDLPEVAGAAAVGAVSRYSEVTVAKKRGAAASPLLSPRNRCLNVIGQRRGSQ